MTDKEKAIAFLVETKLGCKKLRDKELSNVCDISIKAIEKQIPRKCKNFKDICDCGYSVFPHMEYCSKCGQALDWSVEE